VKPLALVALLLPFGLCSCRHAADQSAGAIAPLAPAAHGVFVQAPTAAAGEADSSAKGTWLVPVAVVTLDEGGTGQLRAPEVSSPITWIQDGQEVTIHIEDPSVGPPDTLHGTLTDQGFCISLAPDEELGGVLPIFVRAPAGTEQTIVERTERLAEEVTPKARETGCLSNIRQMNTALLCYVQDYDEEYPPVKADWEGVLEPYLRNRAVFACPEDPEPPSYAMNRRLRSRALADVADPAGTVSVFESDDGRTVAYRHRGGAVYGFADGHATWLEQGADGDDVLTWDPRVSVAHDPADMKAMMMKGGLPPVALEGS